MRKCASRPGRLHLLVAALTFSLSARAGNVYLDCVLDELRNVQNDATAQQVIRLCLSKDPTGVAGYKSRADDWFKKYKSGTECSAAVGRNAAGTVGPQAMVRACYALYEPPNYDLRNFVPANGPSDGWRNPFSDPAPPSK